VPSGFINSAVSMIAINQNGCVSDTVTFNLTIYNELPFITPTGPFCSNDEFTTLSATPIGGVFSGNGIVGNDFYPSNADTLNNIITYSYTQSGCVFNTTTNIIVYERPILSQILPYNEFFELCDGDSIPSVYTTISTVPGGYNEWSLSGNLTESNNFNVTWNTFGTFVLSVINYVNGCVSPEQQTTITIVECPQMLIYIPNTFTPDGDELNNVWLPIFTSGFDPFNFHLQVYNRWGEVIWESHNHTEGWDGTFNNTIVPMGIYAWKVNFGVIGNDDKKVLFGNVNLLR
jgi:gliding motility-associated-like protein